MHPPEHRCMHQEMINHHQKLMMIYREGFGLRGNGREEREKALKRERESERAKEREREREREREHALCEVCLLVICTVSFKSRVIQSQEIALWRFLAPKVPAGARADVGDSTRSWNGITKYVMKDCAEKLGVQIERENPSVSSAVSVLENVILVQTLMFVYSSSDFVRNDRFIATVRTDSAYARATAFPGQKKHPTCTWTQSTLRGKVAFFVV